MSTTFANSIDNNLIYADRAEHDAAGNDLQTTYATKAELPEFSQAEQDAMDSGINSTKVSNYDNHLADTDIHVTTSDKSTWNGKQDAINDLSTIRSGAQAGSTAVQPGDLATVAVSGDYDDLLNKPVIPTVPVQDVTVDGTSVLNAQGVAEITMPSIPVTDVEVDGTSVVNASGVAEITMPTFTQAQADWTEADTTDPSYIQNKPSIPSATSDLTNDSGFITLSDVPAQVNADWNSSSGASEILNKPTIPSGTQLVPAATSADEDKVLTVDSQGVPAWASAQAPISAGDGIDITNNVVSAKVDGTTVDVNASGELTVIGGGGGGTQADWTEDDPTDPSYIENKPTPKTLTAGTNITITESSSTLTVAATWQNAQADWTETDPNEPAYIQHKPTIPSGNQLVPAATSADEGKCLVVDSNGDPEWGTGGKTYTGTDGVVVDNVNDTVGLEAPVDIVAGPGIAIDNPDGNTLRVSANAESFFKELYYNATNTNDTAGKVYALSEPITNFMYAKITVDNMEYTNAPLVYEIDIQHNTTTCQWNSPLRNGNVNNTINLPTCQLQINASGNLVLVARGLTYNTYPSPNFTNGDNRGMRVVRVVGIFRIAGGN